MFATLVSLKTPLALIAAGLLLFAASLRVAAYRSAQADSSPAATATTDDATDDAPPSNDIDQFQQLG